MSVFQGSYSTFDSKKIKQLDLFIEVKNVYVLPIEDSQTNVQFNLMSEGWLWRHFSSLTLCIIVHNALSHILYHHCFSLYHMVGWTSLQLRRKSNLFMYTAPLLKIPHYFSFKSSNHGTWSSNHLKELINQKLNASLYLSTLMPVDCSVRETVPEFYGKKALKQFS